MKGKWIWFVIPVILSGLIGWGAWATVTMTNGTPRETFDRRVEKVDEKFDTVQRELGNKLDDIKQTILDLHSGD